MISIGRQGVVFLFLGIALAAYSFLAGGWMLVSLWPAASFVLVGGAYLGAGPVVFGKQMDGTMSPLSVLVLLPYLSYMWLLWHVIRVFGSESPCDELLPNLWIGRRLLSKEVPAEVERIVDLTCEFVEPAGVRADREYMAVPILDAGTLPAEELLEVARRIDEARVTIVHCAQGHGRTGMVAAAVLLARGAAKSADEAVAMIRERRPGVRLNKRQRLAVEQLEAIISG